MLRDKMQAVMAEVNGEVAEREKLVEYIAIALLTRSNLFILGDTGQAKSYAINRFRSRITGARQFERLLSKQTDEDQLFHACSSRLSSISRRNSRSTCCRRSGASCPRVCSTCSSRPASCTGR